ncbi:MAG: ABC transporter ATP-binding protein [Clostridia bacterium]|nr:ABC transporter ATP-binding protein [Clostridia bacterium]
MAKTSIQKQLLKGNKFNFIFLAFAALLETAIMMCISIMLEKIIAIATAKDLEGLFRQGLVFLIMGAVATVSYLFLMKIKPAFKKRALKQYKNNAYDHILNKSISEFNKSTTSTYVSAFTNDVKVIEENYVFAPFDILTQITLFISSIVIMLLYSPALTGIAIALSIIPMVVMLLVGGKLSVHETNISNQNEGFMHFLRDNLAGFSTIKVFKAEDKIKGIFKNRNNVLESERAKKERTLVLLMFLQSLTTIVAQFGVFFLGAYIAITTGAIQASVIILFVQLMNSVLNPLIQVPTLISKRNSCKPLFKKLDEIIKTEDGGKKESVKFENSVKVNNLEFAYGENNILNGIDFEFKKGKSYALVGASGSGKTTLLNLLAGRYQEYNGEINYDGKELKSLSIDSLFEKMAYVEQNVFVFDDSIVNNVTMYSKVDEDLLNRALEKAGLKALIEEKGVDYKCGENGSNLSGGEKQRISIARALIKNAELLFMDEATSALDAETSSSVMNSVLDIDNLSKIVITHKIEERILKRFDEIIVLKNGKVHEGGSFDELMTKNGVFRSLYELS